MAQRSGTKTLISLPTHPPIQAGASAGDGIVWGGWAGFLAPCYVQGADELHAEGGVCAIHLVIHGLADVVEEAAASGQGGVQAKVIECTIRLVAYTKTIVCLANSRKPPRGRCIAGRELSSNGFGDWIRPVSDRPTREVSKDEQRYEDDTDPRILDIIDVPLVRHHPEGHQHENHVLDSTVYWAKHGVCQWNRLQHAVEDIEGPLWVNGFSSSNGLNDQVPTRQLHRIRRSLYLIRPDTLVIAVCHEQDGFGGKAKRKVRAFFSIGGHEYRVAVTDPLIERQFDRAGDDETELDDALVCMSLGKVFHSYAYKLAASVIIPQ